MPLGGASRWFLSAAVVHLAVAALLVLFDGETAALTTRWDSLGGLLLIGFVGCTPAGFSRHLFPAVSRRRMPKGAVELLAFGAAEAGVIVGTVSLYEGQALPDLDGIFSVAAGLFLVWMGLIVVLFVMAFAHPRVSTPGPEPRAADPVTVPLFLVAWGAAVGAALLVALSGLSAGPGFGWWLAAVLLFVLGHATVRVASVSLRLVPRSLDSDLPRPAAVTLATLAALGAVLVPLGMLVLSPSESDLLAVWALPEAAFALLFVALLAYLGLHARTPRPQLGLELLSGFFLLLGGGLGLWMVSQSNYGPVVAHALVNVLGIIGLKIHVMWFGMIAPYQRISHSWTRRMLWTLAGVWLAGILALAGAGADRPIVPGTVSAIGGGLLLAVALAWGIGTVPVLFPKLNPLPGLTADELRTIRNRWSRR